MNMDVNSGLLQMDTDLDYLCLMEEIAKNLNALMAEHGHDQPTLARLSSVGQGTVSRIVRGIGDPREETLNKLAAVYKKTAADLRGYGSSTSIDEAQNHSVQSATTEKPMTSEMFAKMHGVTSMAVIMLIEKAVTLHNTIDYKKVLDDIRLRCDMIELEMEKSEKTANKAKA